jgi:hypothetical protein
LNRKKQRSINEVKQESKMRRKRRMSRRKRRQI